MDDCVRYGDLLVLRCQEFSGALTSFGFLESSCYLQESPAGDLRPVPNSRSMIFRILPKLSYDSCEDLQRLLQRKNCEVSQERLESLRGKTKLEEDLNQRTTEQVADSLVFYGHEIQLQHLASGMMLTGKHEPAETDRSCYRLLLSETGSEGAHFQMQPHLHLRRIGDPVVYQDLVLLYCLKLQMHLHISSKILITAPLPASSNRALSADMASSAVDFATRYEANVSLEPSAFKLEPFSSGQDVHNLKGGAVIRLLHTELGALLCSEGIDYTKDGLADVFLRKAKSDHVFEEISAHTLFILEQNEAGQFGKTCAWRDGDKLTQYRLRHFTTRRLICVAVDEGSLILSLARHPHELKMGFQPLEQSFGFSSTAIEENNIVRNGSVTYVQTGERRKFWSIPGEQWMTAPQLDAESRGEDLDFFSPFDIDELSVTHTKVLMKDTCDRKDAYRVFRVSEDETREVEFVMSALSTLQRTSVFFEHSLPVTRLALLGLEQVLSKLILFVVHAGHSDPYTCEGQTLPRRQKFLRELGVIDLVCSILRYPFVRGIFRLEVLEVPDLMAKICTLSYRLVRLAAQDNRANELYCAQWMGIFLFHAEHTWQNTALHPEETLTEILSDNRHLLEHHLSQKIVSKFLHLMKQSQDEKYVKLVSTLCVCEGRAVPRNQNTICDILRAEKSLAEAVILPVRLLQSDIEVHVYDSWMKLDSLPQISAERDAERVSGYFLALLDLVANLAQNRNHQMDTMRAFYPLETCFACAFSPALNDTVRSKFLRVLLCLHIDQGDTKPLPLPRFTKLREQANPQAPLTFAKENVPQAVANAKKFVSESLTRFDARQRMDQPERNSLVLEVLRLAHFLVKCGVYSTVQEVRTLIQPLLSLLDGTSDVVSQRASARTQFSLRDKSRYVARPETSVIMQCKEVICSILLTICDIEMDAQLTRMLSLISESDTGIDDEFEEGLSSQASIISPRHRPKQSSLSTVNDKHVVLPGSLLDEAVKTELLDWKMDGKKMQAILLDLMLYEDRAVSSSSFILLVRLFSKKGELVKNLQRVQLLERPEALKAYRQVIAEITDLNNAAEEAEIWVGREKAADPDDTQGRVVAILKHLTDLCSTNKYLNGNSLEVLFDPVHDSEGRLEKILFDPLEAPDTEMQCLLANFKVYEPVLEILSHKGIILGYNEDRTREIMRHCYLFLAKFCQGNKTNQHILFASVEHFLEDLTRNMCAGVLIIEIFRNNPLLCSSIKSRFIRALVVKVHILPMGPSKSWLMSVFQVLMQSNGQHITHNQMDVAIELCRTLDVLRNKEQLKATMAQVKECAQFANQPQSEMVVPLPVAFLTNFIELLGRCADGYNTQVQAICKQVLPLTQAFAMLREAETFWPLRSVMLFFIEKVYLDYEFSHDQLPEADLWYLVEVTNADLELIYQNYTRGGKRFQKQFETKKIFIWDHGVTLCDAAMKYVYGRLLTVLTCVLKKRGSSKQLVTRVDVAKTISYYAVLFLKMSANENQLEVSTQLIRALQGFTQVRKFLEGVQVRSSRRQTRSSTRASAMEHPTRAVRVILQSELVQTNIDAEFMHVVRCIKDVEKITSEALPPGHSITESEFLGSSIVYLRKEVAERRTQTPEFGVKVFRRIIESMNPESLVPAAEWATEDWIRHQVSIVHSQDLFRELHAIPFVLSLYIMTESRAIKAECILFMIALLLGGNEASQLTFLEEMSKDITNQFLLQVKSSLQTSFAALRKLSLSMVRSEQPFDEELDDEEVEYIENPDQEMRNTLRFVQLLCEGHNLKLQEHLREQRTGSTISPFSINLVAFIGQLLCTYTRTLHRCNIEVGHQLLDTLTETVQGPCRSAQADLSQPDVVNCCRDLLTCLRYKHDREVRQLHTKEDREVISALKGKAANFLLSLLEGGGNPEVSARIANFLEFHRIRERMAEVFKDFVEDDLGLNSGSATLADVDNALTRDSFKGHVQEGFSLYMLLQMLAESSAAAQWHLPAKSAKPLEYLAYRFFQQHTGKIEVVLDRVLERVFFPIQPVCRFLSSTRKQELLDNVDRETHASKIHGLLSGSTLLIDEMELNEVRSHHAVMLTFEMYQFLNTLCFIIAFYINLVMLFWYDFTEGDNRYMTTRGRLVIEILGIILVILCGLTLCLWIYVEGILQVQSQWKQRAQKLAKKHHAPLVVDDEYLAGLSTRDTVRILMTRGPEAEEFMTHGRRNFRNCTTALVYYLVSSYYLYSSLTFKVLVLSTVFAGTGLADMFLFCFLLFTIVFRNHTLMGVVRAVIINYKLLLMTLMLAMALWFIYAMWGFYITPWQYWQSGFNQAGWGETLCQNLWQCWLTTMDNGIRLSGGIGDLMIKFPFDDKANWYSRFFLDSSYFFLFRLVVLSIITGIIIDSFAQMREAKKVKEADKKSKCFICNLDRAELDRLGNGYNKHCAEEHNVWHYVYFLIHLKYKDSTEYTGAEGRCASLIKEGNISWVPLHRAFCLQQNQHHSKYEANSRPEN